ncbi:hypothetical protein F53441_6876 [Fusarium austroafricanum]|uniref:Uncharacterized protein n=1 Tax=Fusarium austroafricanum TaxID=2364996 RepID=A0A8H4P6J9_9HYPO|nr:hypothetical protein F53441_6876 [Fusarium austroafricanum]
MTTQPRQQNAGSKKPRVVHRRHDQSQGSEDHHNGSKTNSHQDRQALPLLTSLLVLIVVLIVGFFTVAWRARSIKQETKDLGSAEIKICIAYEALKEINPQYRSTPPDLYTLINISKGTSHQGKILKGFQSKTETFLKEANGLRPGSAQDDKKKQIANWNKVAVVLLEEDVRRVYDQRFLDGWIKSELDKMCGDRWKDNRG